MYHIFVYLMWGRRNRISLTLLSLQNFWISSYSFNNFSQLPRPPNGLLGLFWCHTHLENHLLSLRACACTTECYWCVSQTESPHFPISHGPSGPVNKPLTNPLSVACPASHRRTSNILFLQILNNTHNGFKRLLCLLVHKKNWDINITIFHTLKILSFFSHFFSFSMKKGVFDLHPT